MTPEGKIKKLVRDALAPFTPIDVWMPVPGGYGASRLDFLVCYLGRYIAIETKAPGKTTTARQALCIATLERAGAKVFVIYDAAGVLELTHYLTELTAVGNLFEKVGV